MPPSFSRSGSSSQRGSPYDNAAKKALFLTSTFSKGHKQALADRLEEVGAKLGGGLSQKLLEAEYPADWMDETGA